MQQQGCSWLQQHAAVEQQLVSACVCKHGTVNNPEQSTKSPQAPTWSKPFCSPRRLQADQTEDFSYAAPGLGVGIHTAAWQSADAMCTKSRICKCKFCHAGGGGEGQWKAVGSRALGEQQSQVSTAYSVNHVRDSCGKGISSSKV